MLCRGTRTKSSFLHVTVTLGTRAQPGMGKHALDALYLKLGQTEIDDLAAGVRALGERPFVDADRIGIYGTSYGGYAALMSLLRYPDLFAAASVSSAPSMISSTPVSIASRASSGSDTFASRDS